MNKKRIATLIGLISIAVFGLIAVQGLWIKQAYQLKEQQFHQLIKNAITVVSNKLQEDETVNQIKKEIYAFHQDSLQKNAPITFNPYATNSEQPINQLNGEDPKFYVNSKVTITSQGGMLSDSIWYQQEFYSEIQSQKVSERKNIQTQLSKKVDDQMQFIKRIYDKMMKPGRKFQERTSSTELGGLIKSQLYSNGISLPFEYAVLDEKRDIVMHSESFDKNTQARLFGGAISANDLVSSPNILVLYLPPIGHY